MDRPEIIHRVTTDEVIEVVIETGAVLVLPMAIEIETHDQLVAMAREIPIQPIAITGNESAKTDTLVGTGVEAEREVGREVIVKGSEVAKIRRPTEKRIASAKEEGTDARFDGCCVDLGAQEAFDSMGYQAAWI